MSYMNEKVSTVTWSNDSKNLIGSALPRRKAESEKPCREPSAPVDLAAVVGFKFPHFQIDVDKFLAMWI